MKLCAIFHCWGDWDLLEHSVKHMRPLVDGIIIIGSNKSNYGEYEAIPEEWLTHELYVREPQFTHPMNSETEKRNYGLKIAREKGYTHFINCDADEFYNPVEFEWGKLRIKSDEHELHGLVCKSQVYFKKPTLTIGIDTTLVTFIHKLTPDLKFGFNRDYPFAFDNRRDIRIDPTRQLNIVQRVEMAHDITMHHYSYIRKDYAKKIRNSTAKANIEKSTILEDLENAKPGYFCKFYQKTLHEVPDYFNLGNFS